jgi:hypothetical protein
VAVRRFDRSGAAWTLAALSAIYLMLFNPRTETCSYVLLGPFLATAALACFRIEARHWLGWTLALAALGCACDAVPVVHNWTDRWLKPLIALLFLPVVIYFFFDAESTILERAPNGPSAFSPAKIRGQPST